MKFTYDVAVPPKPSKIHRLMALLDTLPNGRLVDSKRLAEMMEQPIKEFFGVAMLGAYKHTVGRRNYWGNKATIAAFKKEAR